MVRRPPDQNLTEAVITADPDLPEFALEAAGMGVWQYLITTGVFRCSRIGKRLLGLPEEDGLYTFESFLSCIHAEDLLRVHAAVKASLVHENSVYPVLDEVFRVSTPVNRTERVRCTGKMWLDGDQQPLFLTGVLSVHKVVQTEEQLRTISDMAPVMIWMSGKDRAFCFLNKAWLAFTGKDGQDETETGWYQCMHPEDVQKWMRVYAPSFDKQEAFRVEFRLQRSDGQYRWVSCSGQPRLSGPTLSDGYIGSCVDIHDQKLNEEALEARVLDRTTALTESNTILQQRNSELEQFAYVTSHDLQEPLRKIRIFVDILQKQDEVLGADKERLGSLSRIRSSADRMAQLIKDLLGYSRLGIEDNPFVPTDLNTIVLTALRDFDLMIEETKARINIMSLPTIEAIPLQMNQLFYNLIGNALKFQRSGKPPLLKIYSQKLTPSELTQFPNLEPLSPYCRVIVEDNGIGFNQEFVDKIFIIFQRLNAKEHFPGTGIGLAICRKIVQNHRGEILAFGKEDEGASFHLILPQHHAVSNLR